MAARKPAGKETRTEALERETIQEFGSLVAPSFREQVQVVAHVKLAGSSQYRAFFKDGISAVVSQSRLKSLLLEDLAEEALA